MEIVCESRIRHVEVFARGAVVTRELVMPADLPSGDVELVVPRVTPLAAAGSARARVRGGRRDIVLVRARLAVPQVPAAPGEVIARVRELELEREAVDLERRYVFARRQALSAARPQPRLDVPWRGIDPRARVADALAAAGVVDALLADLDRRLVELEEKLVDLGRRLERARLAAEQARSAERMGAAHPSLEIIVHLGGGGGGGAGAEAGAGAGALEVSYAVAAARWWPVYAARLATQKDGGLRAAWSLEAIVAQTTGEDWSCVELALATVDLVRDVQLPELNSQRLGRAQPAPRKGFRPPPEGLERLFESYDAAMTRLPPAPAPAPPPPLAASAPRDALRDTAPTLPPPPAAPMAAMMVGTRSTTGAPPPPAPPARGGAASYPQHQPVDAMVAAAAPAFVAPLPAGAAFGGAPPAKARRVRAPAAPPPPQQEYEQRALRRVEPEELGALGDEETTAVDGVSPFAPAPEPAEDWLDFDGLVAAPLTSPRRGRLVQAPRTRRDEHAARAALGAIEGVRAPAHGVDPRASGGRGPQVRYEATAPADVPSNALGHRVSLTSADGAAIGRLVAVPRESPDVYREVTMTNPFDLPMMPGPVDVFVDGALVTTSPTGVVGVGGKIALGLGVEDRVRVARNARVAEASAGLLGGKTAVEHVVTIELASALGAPVIVDVLDRVPVSDDKDVEVELRAAQPKPEKYAQEERGAPVRGGQRWRVEVPAAGKARVEFAYRVTLPAKSELRGGNRRD